ncbi:MAG: hypothetical protein CVU06_04245 [Bacteroidetes bacterium HGW-Bacteroidetes-22]|nr:MAG: hypothetical protein CVU06_04245 [Bacteroidetes bacterium HGW-Bacteroidetes-22]
MDVVELNICRLLLKKSLLLMFLFVTAGVPKIYATVHSNADSLIKQLSDIRGTEKAKTLLKLSTCYINSDDRRALHYTVQAYTIAHSCKDDALAALCLIQQGLAYNNLGSYDSSIQTLNEAMLLHHWPPESPNLARLFTTLGIANENSGHTDQALTCYQKAFEIYRKSNNYQGIANSNLNIGCLFSRQKKYTEANEYLEKALSVSLKNNVTISLGSIYNNLGVVCDVRNQKEKALEWYTKALEIQTKQGNKSGMANIYHNMAMIYCDKHDYEKALENQKKSLELKLATGNREGTANSFSLMADILINMRRFNEAEPIAEKALAMASEGNYKVVEALAHKQMADIYHQQGRDAEAFKQLLLTISLKDSIYSQTVSEQLSEMQTRYEVKQKEQDNEILRQQISLQQAKEIEQRDSFRFLTFIVIATTAVLILLFILLRVKILSMRKTKRLYDQDYRLKELELAAIENDYRRMEAEKRQEAAEKTMLLQKLETEKEIRKLESENLNARIELKNKELTSLSANFINKNETLGRIRKALMNLRRHFKDGAPDALNELLSTINSNLDYDLNWKKFRFSFEETHPRFFDKLNDVVPDLTPNEQKLCAYLYINLSSKEIAQIMNISLSSVNKNRQRLRKKLNLPPEGDIYAFLSNL